MNLSFIFSFMLFLLSYQWVIGQLYHDSNGVFKRAEVRGAYFIKNSDCSNRESCR